MTFELLHKYGINQTIFFISHALGCIKIYVARVVGHSPAHNDALIVRGILAFAQIKQ